VRAHWERYVALATGICGVVAMSWLAWSVVSGLPSPYSYQQLEHATTVIGGPPGFSAGPFVSINDAGFGTPAEYAREFYGSASSDAEYAWFVSRLRSLGFTNVRQNGFTACQKFGVSINPGLPIGATSAAGVEVVVVSEEMPDSGPACPAGLFG
jgi:hypothetical protein